MPCGVWTFMTTMKKIQVNQMHKQTQSSRRNATRDKDLNRGGIV